MSYGIPEYNAAGLLKCELCLRYYSRVARHVWIKHNMTVREYKELFGFNVRQGLCSESSRKKSQDAVNNHPEVIAALKANSALTRFKIGCEGQTRDKMSEQQRLTLAHNFESEQSKLLRVEQGRKMGKANLGRKHNNKKGNTNE